MSGSHDTANHDRPPAGGRIDLARETAIRLGALVIDPGLRRIAHDDGREEIVEPRVMQVLVALVRASGGIVTRDDLLATCWHGVVVGEDAITRVMGRLRRLTEGIGDGQFKLETITKVGYRLVAVVQSRESSRALAQMADGEPSEAVPLEPLLAVMAFDDLSPGGDMAYFSDGVSEEILQTVASGAALKVIGRGSSFQFHGSEKSAAHVATALKATHVLDGSVRRSRNRVRIAAHLIECAGETTLWSDRFDRDLTDIFALQDEIAAAVAAALRVVFEPTPKSEPIDPSAYELYLKGHALGSGSFNDAIALTTAAGFFEQATQLAPRFARAWSLLALASMFQLRVHGTDRPYAEMRAKIVGAAETALTLNPRLGDAYIALAGLEPVANYVEREALFKKALSVAPNDPAVLASVAGFYFQTGRFREAFEYANQGFDLDPINMMAANTYGVSLVVTGRYWESRELWDRIVTTWPDAPVFLGNAIGYAGSAHDWERFEDLVGIAKERGSYNAYIRQIVAFYRNTKEISPRYVAGFLQYAHDELAKTGNIRENILGNMCRLGLADEAFDLTDRASFDYVWDPEQLWRGAFNSGNILSVALHEDLMRDRRFPHLCAKLGLCDYWAKTERWPDCAAPGVLPYDFKAAARALSTV